MLQANKILEFWFGKPEEPGYGKPRKVWFTKNPEFDQEVRSRFFSVYQQAAAGQLDDWTADHFKVIERFGRFPHRNQILDRETTPEEAEFLKQRGSSF